MISRRFTALAHRAFRKLDPMYLIAAIQVMAIASFITDDKVWVVAAAGLLPMLLVIQRVIVGDERLHGPRDRLTGLLLRQSAEKTFDKWLNPKSGPKQTCACVAIDIDDFHAFNERWGRAAADDILRILADRLRAILRKDDMVVRLDADAFALALAPSHTLTLDTALSVGERIQRALAEPLPVNGTSTYVSVCIGIAMSTRVPDANGANLLSSAERAMVEARAHCPGALRVFSAEMQNVIHTSHALAEDVAKALETGQIKAWFQPQLSTDTGEVTGFEALSRWAHADRGRVPPSEFLPAIEATGRLERLSEIMLYQSFAALNAWERAGFFIPSVGVNFSAPELRNPQLVDKIKWDLDRFSLAPDRLTVEVLESVVSETKDDIIVRNMLALAEMGCRIDLDDFGTGNASISNIRRFRINRIKIDRSFVAHVDRDGEQQRMIASILSMAQQLDVEALGEGVETLGEHSVLGQLGCAHVQGYAVGKPMPLEDSFIWLRDHSAKREPVPPIVDASGQNS